MSNFDPISRLQQIAATLDDGGHFDAPATAAHYINCAIREIERLQRECGEARREIGDSLQTLIHFRQERDTLRAERDEARQFVCNREYLMTGMDTTPQQIAKDRGWDCFPQENSK